MDKLFTNHECPNCKGSGFLQDGGNVWKCEDCEGKDIVSSAYLIWLEELENRTEIEANTSEFARAKRKT